MMVTLNRSEEAEREVTLYKRAWPCEAGLKVGSQFQFGVDVALGLNYSRLVYAEVKGVESVILSHSCCPFSSVRQTPECSSSRGFLHPSQIPSPPTCCQCTLTPPRFFLWQVKSVVQRAVAGVTELRQALLKGFKEAPDGAGVATEAVSNARCVFATLATAGSGVVRSSPPVDVLLVDEAAQVGLTLPLPNFSIREGLVRVKKVMARDGARAGGGRSRTGGAVPTVI